MSDPDGKGKPLDPRVRALFEGPNFGHLATAMSDGSPHVLTLWFGIEGDDPTFVKVESSLSVRNLRRDPRVAVSINNVEDPYEEAHVRGRAVEFQGDPEARLWLDERSVAYTGSKFTEPLPDPLVLVRLRIYHANFSHSTHAQHTPPGSPLQLSRRSDG